MPLMPYLRFFVANRRFVAFGFLAALASSFGQTYFLGTFSASIESELSLSHSGWALVYLVGTLASAIALPTTGKFIDVMPLPRYTASALVVLIAGTAVMAVAVALSCSPWRSFSCDKAGRG